MKSKNRILSEAFEMPGLLKLEAQEDRFSRSGIKFNDYFQIFRMPVKTLSRHLKGASGMMVEYLLKKTISVWMLYELIAIELINTYDSSLNEIYITLDYIDALG